MRRPAHSLFGRASVVLALSATPLARQNAPTPAPPEPDAPLSADLKLEAEVWRRVRAAEHSQHEYEPDFAPYWLAPRARAVLLDVHERAIGARARTTRAFVSLVAADAAPEKR